jgi:hypothetical protein
MKVTFCGAKPRLVPPPASLTVSTGLRFHRRCLLLLQLAARRHTPSPSPGPHQVCLAPPTPLQHHNQALSLSLCVAHGLHPGFFTYTRVLGTELSSRGRMTLGVGAIFWFISHTIPCQPKRLGLHIYSWPRQSSICQDASLRCCPKMLSF